jgi:hypothetical protein
MVRVELNKWSEANRQRGSAVEVLMRACAADLNVLRGQLEPLESGNMHIGERPFLGTWTDTTFKQICHLRKIIDDLEAIVARLKPILIDYERAPNSA